jgi:hypothetical protein
MLAGADSFTVALRVDETQALLTEVPPVYHTQINDVLLAALVQACAVWSDQPTLLVDLEGHGREELFADVDLSRTVGWFTSLIQCGWLRVGPGAACGRSRSSCAWRPPGSIWCALPGPRLSAVQTAAAEASFSYLGRLIGSRRKGVWGWRGVQWSSQSPAEPRQSVGDQWGQTGGSCT